MRIYGNIAGHFSIAAIKLAEVYPKSEAPIA
jgi:hypothetical protein